MLRASKRKGILKLDNGLLTLQYGPEADTLTICSGERVFVRGGRLSEPAAKTRIVTLDGPLGEGKGIEVEHPSGSVTTLALHEGLPFLCATASVHNDAEEPVCVAEVTPLEATLAAWAPRKELRALGSDGPHTATCRRASYAFMAVAQPTTRAGVVCGWLTHHRASGIVRLDGRGKALAIRGDAEYGRLVVRPGETAEGETFAIGWFDDALDGLEQYADAIAQAHGIRLPETIPSGYCTWYHARALDAERTAEIADFCEREMADYGLEFVQIDDGWQIGGRDFTAHNPDGPYPKGMKPTADAITRHGLTAGIWLIPFGWDPEAPPLADHADWFAHRADGSIYDVHWAGSCLDMTHPHARRLLREVVARMTKQWGFRYLKLDGLWSGIAVKILYPKPTYRRDDLGGAVLYNPRKTQVEAYRDGLKLVRRTAGKDTFLLGCCIAQNMRSMGGSIGLVDGMRIGPDVGASWDGVVRCAQPTSHLYFLNGRVWFNDPDCLMLREPLTVDQGRAWASVIALSGQMNVVSEWLPGLPPERLDVVKRTMPNPGVPGRPLDLFERALPRLWHAHVGEGELEQHLVGLFNWDASRSARMTLRLADLGLPASSGDRYVGFDYWEDEFVEPFTESLTVRLRPGSCRVLSLRRLADRPQLVSTSRHVTQGEVELWMTEWDPESEMLVGGADVVGGDPYEVRLAAPQGWTATHIGVTGSQVGRGVTASLRQDGPWVRARIDSPVSQPIIWTVGFDQEDN